MGTILRAARGDDRSALFTLVTQFPTPTPCPLDTFSVLFDAKLEDRTACVLVAEREGHLVGYISGSVRTAFYAGGTTAWVDEIFVAPDVRGTGMGRRLMSAFEEWAARHESVLVALATRGAAGFYERLGYASGAGYFKKYLTTTPPRDSA